MKLTIKQLFTLLFILLIGTSYGYTNNVSYKDIEGKYGVFFCNNKEKPTTDLKITTNIGEKNKICLYFINDSDYDLEMKAGFVSATNISTSSGAKILSCNDLKEPGAIGNYIEKTRESPITIPAHNKIMKELYITFPIGTDGLIESCMVSGLEKIRKHAGNMFNIDFLTARYVDFFVVGDFTGGNIISIGNTNIYLDNIGKLVIDGEINNEAPLNNIVNISGTITNIFGYKQSFSLKNIGLNAGSSINFSTQNLELNSFIPRYKGLYTINLNINYKPVFDFDVSNLNLDKELLEEKTIKYSTTYFEMPRLIGGAIILIIFLLILAFKKPKQKIVYVQQPQPTPNV